MWERLKPFDFYSVHSLFFGRDVRDSRIKGEVLEDMKRQATFQGYEDHAIFRERWDDSAAKPMPTPSSNPTDAKLARHGQLERGF